MVDFLETLQSALGDAYHIERELSPGGMSRLILATDTAAFGRHVVIKVLPPDLVSPQSTARFKREVDVTAHLQHPNVLPVLGAGVRAGLLYYIMPYVEGESLRRRLDSGQRYSVAGALRVLREVADALAYAHGRGVVHRDIKPENILLADGHALVADFGIARGAMSPTTLDGTMMPTATGVSIGTLGYMAPEQLFPTGPVDARVDIYSLGVVAYELLSGAPPFTASGAAAIAAAHLTETPRPLTEVVPELPEDLSAAVAKALAKDPNDRQQSAAELRDAFESSLSMLQTGTALRTPPAPTAALPPPPPRRRAAPLLAIGAVTIAAIVAIAGAAFLAARARETPDVDENRILVAPFDVQRGMEFASWDGAELWTSTLLNVATRHLDGMGPLTTVDAATVSREWKGKADANNARAVARDHEAGLAVFGGIAPGTGDTVVVQVQILDVANGRTLSEVSAKGEEGRPDLLAGTLALAVVNALREVRTITATPNAGLGSLSMTAVKEFAKGEGFYRNTLWDSALVHYERAIGSDSTFALAFRRAGQSVAWLRHTDDPEARAYLLKAGALNRSLSPHDSLLIVADSLSSTLPADDTDPTWVPKVRRLMAVWNTAVSRYPSDVEVWYGRGDAAYHFGYGPGVGVVDRQVLRDFARAVELNRSFAPAYEHAIELAFTLNHADSARKYAEWYLALNPRREDASTIRLVKQIADFAAAQSAELDVLFATADSTQLSQAWNMLRRWPDPEETALRAARALTKRGVSGGLFFDPRLRESLQLAYRGHAAEAGEQLAALDTLRTTEALRDALVVDYALVGAIPAARADTIFGGWLDDYEKSASTTFPWWTLPWWARQRNAAAIQRVRDLASRNERETDPAQRALARYVSVAARGYHELVSGDSVNALATLRSLPDSVCVACYVDRLETARLLASRNELGPAALLLDERPNRFLTPMEVPLAMERARVAAKLGRQEKAVDAFALVANSWGRADNSLDTLVNEARNALAALRARARAEADSQ